MLILDGLEPLQYPPGSPLAGELKDQGISALLSGLATASQGLCLVTTRLSLPDLKAFWSGAAPEVALKRLSRSAGVDMLKKLGVRGSEDRRLNCHGIAESLNEFEALVEEVQGHALSLTLLGGYLRRAHSGDIRRRDRVDFSQADAKADGGHAFRIMAAYEQWLLSDGGEEGKRQVAVLQLMGLFDRPADKGCLAALRSEAIPGLTDPLVGLAEEDWGYCLSGLEAAHLLTVQLDDAGQVLTLDAHPLLRSYFAEQLRTTEPETWKTAHSCLYHHLCTTTPDLPQPKLEDLQPLYQAVVHGCLAGLQREARSQVYRDRILRGTRSDGFYSINHLGLFGLDLSALACFFSKRWTKISPAFSMPDQAWLIGQTAFCLRALGRLQEAFEPFRAGLKLNAQLKIWENAASNAGALSESELCIGKIADAIQDAKKALKFADRSGNNFVRLAISTTLANAFHQKNLRGVAQKYFLEAEKIQIECDPHAPLLYSVQGFRYCELLLTETERNSWQTWTNAITPSSRMKEICKTVENRCKKILNWRTPSDPLLTIALEHLSLARVMLYRSILEATPLSTDNLVHFVHAVVGLRNAGQQDHLPLGLLSRSWLRAVQGQFTGPDSAQVDLDEAWEIARRGPMRLFQADIHLYRARLFLRHPPYPWTSPQEDLRQARHLIESCGYWRRKEELEDAEAALGL